MAKKIRSTIGEDPLDALVPYDESVEDAEERRTSDNPEPAATSVASRAAWTASEKVIVAPAVTTS